MVPSAAFHGVAGLSPGLFNVISGILISNLEMDAMANTPEDKIQTSPPEAIEPGSNAASSPGSSNQPYPLLFALL